jgi:hypothetical protein
MILMEEFKEMEGKAVLFKSICEIFHNKIMGYSWVSYDSDIMIICDVLFFAIRNNWLDMSAD